MSTDNPSMSGIAPRLCRLAAALVLAAVPLSQALGQQVMIEAMVAEVSQTQYRDFHLAIEDMGLGLYGGPPYDQGYRGRDTFLGTDDPGNQEAQLYLVDQFQSWGLTVNTQGLFNNVVAELPGQMTPEKIYIVGAHFDTTEALPAPGGDDNASGTAGLLEAARIMSQYRFASTIRFIGFNAEEDGLLGSVEYVFYEVMTLGEDVVGMIALDMILRPQNDADPAAPIDLDLDCQYGPGDAEWVDEFLDAAATYVPQLAIDPTTPFTALWAGSDHLSFTTLGYPAFMCIENTEDEIFGGANDYIHTSQDWSQGPAGAAFDYDFATNVVRATVATLAQAAGVLPPQAITVTATTDRDWVYQNTLGVTGGRHMVALAIAIDDDPNGNTSYQVTVTANPPAAVVIEPTADLLVWHIRGGAHGVDPVGPVTLGVQVAGLDVGGQGLASTLLAVRLLGDLDGNGGPEPGDVSLLIMKLNGVPPAGYDPQAFDLDANGGAEPGDVQVLINILNGLSIP